MTDEKKWRVLCAAAIIGLYGACKLCQRIGLDPFDLLTLVVNNIPELQRAEKEAKS